MYYPGRAGKKQNVGKQPGGINKCSTQVGMFETSKSSLPEPFETQSLPSEENLR